MPALSTILQPHVRNELISCLSELQADNPARVWHDERQSGLVSGIDSVFHFFFDDHDFDNSAVGYSLIDQVEVRSIDAVKAALEAILNDVGDTGDDGFVSHPLWIEVRQAAAAASNRLAETV